MPALRRDDSVAKRAGGHKSTIAVQTWHDSRMTLSFVVLRTVHCGQIRIRNFLITAIMCRRGESQVARLIWRTGKTPSVQVVRNGIMIRHSNIALNATLRFNIC